MDLTLPPVPDPGSIPGRTCPTDADRAALRRGRLSGWHRSVCMHVGTRRGTSEAPGLMMAPERGGSCTGLVMRLDPGRVAEDPERLPRRAVDIRDRNPWRLQAPVAREIGALHGAP